MSRFNYAIRIFALAYFFIPLSISNPILKPYKKEVMDIIKTHCKMGEFNNPPKQFLYFRKLKDGLIGQCGRSRLGFFYTIEIDPGQWNTLSEEEKFETITHEISHCVLMEEHVDNPTNYMYYRLVSLPKELVIKQLLDNIKLRCGR